MSFLTKTCGCIVMNADGKSAYRSLSVVIYPCVQNENIASSTAASQTVAGPLVSLLPW